MEVDRNRRRRAEKRRDLRRWCVSNDLVDVYELLVGEGFFDIADVAEWGCDEFRQIRVPFGDRFRYVT